ncbi:MAG TPA: hypothetical protein VKM55_03150 [Candidatus Lokiarchaeia archaeon]|nr:hypothetical protein [Candidatus Lokiarchaeia archaeon]
MVDKVCSECGGTSFRNVVDAWMKRTFSFVEKGTLMMCENCGAKFLQCPKCGALVTRVHPALEAWEVSSECSNCGFVNPDIRAWDGTSPNPNKL